MHLIVELRLLHAQTCRPAPLHALALEGSEGLSTVALTDLLVQP